MIFPAAIGTIIGAHRGASADAPENTLAAFDLAVAQGAELIECDVRCTSDGYLVVHHDVDTLRTAGQPDIISDRTLVQLLAVDVGSRKDPSFRGERIPTLPTVLDRYGASVFLNVEIKVEPTPYQAIDSLVADSILARGLVDRVVVSSFDIETILRLRRSRPDIRASLLYQLPQNSSLPPGVTNMDCLKAAMILASTFGAVGVHLQHDLISPETVDLAGRLGLGILAWTVDDPQEMDRLVGLGVQAILSNSPALLRRVVTARR